MNGLKFSDILGPWFYSIGLSDEDKRFADYYFYSAAHHFHRFKESGLDFHLIRHRAALRHLITLVYTKGDFTEAYDPSLKDLDERESWNPDVMSMPYPTMFNSQKADPRFPVGSPHESDLYLNNLIPNALPKSQNSKFFHATENGKRVTLTNV